MIMKADSKELYIPRVQIGGKKNPDDTYTLTALDLKNLNDILYAIIKKVQGGLTFADMTKEVNQEYTSMDGKITSIQATADGLVVTVQGLSNRNTVSIDENGMYVTNAAGQTSTLTGNHIKSGTIEGVTLVSDNGLSYVEVGDGAVFFNYGGQFRGSISGTPDGLTIQPRAGYPIQLFGDVQVGEYGETNINGSAVRISSGGNMSINSSGKTFIATNDAYSGDVDIGQAGGTINLRGNVLVNGTPI